MLAIDIRIGTLKSVLLESLQSAVVRDGSRFREIFNEEPLYCLFIRRRFIWLSGDHLDHENAAMVKCVSTTSEH